MKRKFITLTLFLLLLTVFSPVQAQTPAVRAVLFYSPTCPHCHEVMTNDLPPLVEQYGDQLQILAVNVTTQEGQTLYQMAITMFSIPQERRGVPAMIVGNTLLVGSTEIPSWLPGIIEQGLASGGIDWPALPGLTSFLEAQGFLQETAPSFTVAERFALDPVGNSLAVAVLVGMVISVFLTGYASTKRIKIAPWPGWVVPVLLVVGLAVAGYLAFVETTGSEAICGPVGDCNTVQQSEYARLFGVLPIGMLGIVGYLSIGAAWVFKQYGSKELAELGSRSIWLLVLGGTVFSIYLTFLEPFVIGATCAWCLSSSVIMTLLLWATMPVKSREVKRRH